MTASSRRGGKKEQKCKNVDNDKHSVVVVGRLGKCTLPEELLSAEALRGEPRRLASLSPTQAYSHARPLRIAFLLGRGAYLLREVVPHSCGRMSKKHFSLETW